MVEAGEMTLGLVGTCGKTPPRRVAGATGADVGFHHQAIAFVGTQPLLRQVNLDSFRTANTAGRACLRSL